MTDLLTTDHAHSGEIPPPTAVEAWIPELDRTRDLTGRKPLPPTWVIRFETDGHAAINIPQSIGVVDGPVRRRRSVPYVLPADRERVPGGRHRVAESLAGPLVGWAGWLAAAALILWVVTW